MTEPTEQDIAVASGLFDSDGPSWGYNANIIAAYREECLRAERERLLAGLNGTCWRLLDTWERHHATSAEIREDVRAFAEQINQLRR